MKNIILLAAIMAALAGCNTVAGVGDDIGAAPRTVQGWF
ncbi:lipoprotein [Paenirhodobacter enshiensis]